MGLVLGTQVRIRRTPPDSYFQPMTLEDAQTQFSVWAFTQFAKPTFLAYDRSSKRLCRHLSDKNVEAATSQDIIGYNKKMMDEGDSDSTISHEMCGIKTFLKFLKRNGWTDWDPDLIRVPRYSVCSFKAVSKDEADVMIDGIFTDTFGDLRDKTLLAFMYATGLRVSEISGTRLDDLDVPARSGRVFMTKVNKARRIYWDDRTDALLKEYLPARARRAKSEFLFLSLARPKCRLSVSGIEVIVAKRRTLEWITPHCFRHGLARRCVQAGIHPRHIQKLLGHANIASTQIYMDVYDSETKDEYAKLCTVDNARNVR